MKKFFSRESILPDRTNHYDESGHKVGYSRKTLLGYTNHYDENGTRSDIAEKACSEQFIMMKTVER